MNLIQISEIHHQLLEFKDIYQRTRTRESFDNLNGCLRGASLLLALVEQDTSSVYEDFVTCFLDVLELVMMGLRKFRKLILPKKGLMKHFFAKFIGTRVKNESQPLNQINEWYNLKNYSSIRRIFHTVYE